MFRKIEIVEEEISRAKKRDPKNADRYDAAFPLLKPTSCFNGKADRVFRSHARELLWRVKRRKDIRPGTAAEVLCAMLAAATVAPLNQEGRALTDRLFQIVMRTTIDDTSEREAWKGQVRESFEEAQRKTRADWRKL